MHHLPATGLSAPPPPYPSPYASPYRTPPHPLGPLSRRACGERRARSLLRCSVLQSATSMQKAKPLREPRPSEQGGGARRAPGPTVLTRSTGAVKVREHTPATPPVYSYQQEPSPFSTGKGTRRVQLVREGREGGGGGGGGGERRHPCTATNRSRGRHWRVRHARRSPLDWGQLICYFAKWHARQGRALPSSAARRLPSSGASTWPAEARAASVQRDRSIARNQ